MYRLLGQSPPSFVVWKGKKEQTLTNNKTTDKMRMQRLRTAAGIVAAGVKRNRKLTSSMAIARHVFTMMLALLLSATMASCDEDEDEGPDYSKYQALFSTVGTFVDNFDRSYTYSYSLSGSSQKTTSDYKYVVTPIGRLISITPKSSMSKSELTAVKEALEWKFGKNSARRTW